MFEYNQGLTPSPLSPCLFYLLLYRYKLLLLDVMVKLLTGISRANDTYPTDIDGYPPSPLIFAMLRLALSCLPRHLRKDAYKIFLQKKHNVHNRELNVDAIHYFIKRGVLRYHTNPAPAGAIDKEAGAQQIIAANVLQTLDRIVVIMNIFQTLVSCKWEYLKHTPRVRWTGPVEGVVIEN
jgi:hypothetical protein